MQLNKLESSQLMMNETHLVLAQIDNDVFKCLKNHYYE